MANGHDGVTWYEEDRDSGPFHLRQGGSNNWVTSIDPHDRRSVPPGSVEYGDKVVALEFDTLDNALAAADSAVSIDGVHLSVEPTP
tara:strand:- start:193 stop:450 length:258 start_codon:yes stop_codon:yes gene_type:complete